MTTNTEKRRKKLNFIFDKNSNKDEFRASNLIKACQLFNGDWKEGRETFFDGDTFRAVYDIIVHEVDGLDTFTSDFGNEDGECWVFVLHWLRPYLVQPHMVDVIEHLHKLQDHSREPGNNRNIAILADYGHESHIPGSMGRRFLEEYPHYDPSRYLHSNISLDNQNVGAVNPQYEQESRPGDQFEVTVPSLHYVTGVLAEIDKNRPVKLKEQIATYNKKNIDPAVLFQPMFKYLIPNRIGRASRRQLIVSLDDRGLLQDTEWSMVHPDGQPDLPWEYNDEYKKRFGTRPVTMSRPFEGWSGPRASGSPDQGIPDDLARSAICYVATETYPTYFDNDDPTKPLNFPLDNSKPFCVLDASEKSFKPFIYGLIPFIYGRAGLVDKWRELGMWLPGDYGNEECHIDRMEAMIDAMEEFTTNNLPITVETVNRIIGNHRLSLTLDFHQKLSRPLFNAIAHNY